MENGERICPKCGNEINGRFCGQCGFDTESGKGKDIECPVCHSLIPAGTRFCPNCGYNPKHLINLSQFKLKKKLTKKQITIISLVSVFVVLFVTVISCCFYTRVQPMWVNGIELGSPYTQVAKKLGKPDESMENQFDKGKTYWWFYKVSPLESIEYDIVGKDYRYVEAEFDEEGKLVSIVLDMKSAQEKTLKNIEHSTTDIAQGF